MKKLTPFKLARLRVGLSQEELAAKLGVTAGAVSQWETGRTVPGIKLLRPLAEILNISVEDLLKKVG